ncbi:MULTISPECIES: pilus assembly protein [unclassified Paenibacillus]|uniref:TadE/TadG family type IV pilus assembly protein n=1 Tax=unclassified Paenibacillus TaxID=185978 RepID=UPI001AE8CCC2|nr:MULTISPECIES: pilus assembly protein [unclassified Paenibacillus]MBP1155491.1 hypothetical protein [Paenibacillus sp. PvP091]MBP1169123.1 hypothetical protein [Paenibacillus sp. PvR098]MBP2440151.1 hypothetical protein [Paenibacillus sp. PvP052]
MYKRIYRFLRDPAGQITLEASLTLPVIFLATVLLLFLALFSYHQASLHYTAAMTADRAAYIWDNSRKDPYTGAVKSGENDGLYWRLTNDNVSHMFSFLLPMPSATVSLPLNQNSATPDGGPQGKLVRAASTMSADEAQGELGYENYGVLRLVRAALHKPVQLPDFAERLWGKANVSGVSKSYVIDPVETIRTTDLTRTFIGEIQGRIKPRDALAAMVEPKTSIKEPQQITGHEQAAKYLQVLVSGKEDEIEVHPGTKRIIDAIDAGGVAHAAYYHFTEKQLREVQMPKDAELLKKGKVNGVVWHFFKRSDQAKVKLSSGLLRELERNGVVVVIHE